MRNATLKQLRAVAAIVETGTVTAAAKRLNVTPPAVTMQVQQLEEHLGLPLLDRAGDRFQPSAAGREVLAAVARIEQAMADCGAALDAMRGLRAGRVDVGLVSTAKYFAPAALGAFARTHPGIDVSLTVGNREEMIAALRSDAIDVAIMGRPPLDIEVDKTLIGDHPHLMIAPVDHPLVGRRVAPSALANASFLSREPGSGTRGLMERFFQESGIEPRIAMEIGSNETIKQAVMAGLGLAFISSHTIAAEVADGRLAILDIEGLPVVRQWFVVKRTAKRLTPPAAALAEFLGRRGSEFLPGVSPAAPAPAREASPI
ncbi:LysR family transcriptional regulator [Ancylobacter mangrovi]|uniref:HTH-type transcriptional regulator CbbR n=1 Tax=Ancylobacter mangrovi TaxID=2972472 RepID=A0A9X2PEC9_9HYPH|nr:LysR family transcriptional regulator [Ancylobacter mangrovi]MCS0495829.1 LysR family transcriptional regulator [Ancylobacter mangrovi]MCS0502731.1 LysR family transcriptional regulator [Ancylobacter mangrovi]